MNLCLQHLLVDTLCVVEMLKLFLGTLPLLSTVVSTPLDTTRYLIDSHPIMFLHDRDADSQIVNSTLVLKRKLNSKPPGDYSVKKNGVVVNTHNSDSSGVVWRLPHKPVSHNISNHKDVPMDSKQFHKRPSILSSSQPFRVKEVVNNHNPATQIRSRPPPQRTHAASLVSVLDNLTPLPATDVLGSRLKPPDTVHSTAIQVKDAPKNVRTTIKHNKIIVIEKRKGQLPINFIDADQQTVAPHIFASTPEPGKKNFSVAAVMDHWSHVPIPSSPSWGQSTVPVKGGIARPVVAQTVVPNIPFMPFISSLISPLLSRPLTPSAVNSGMQGIKAMQGFLRNSLMGAMFCFLPSAFIALSLTATQRAQLRKIPEIDGMMGFCKKCIENLREIKELQNSNGLNWLKDHLQ